MKRALLLVLLVAGCTTPDQTPESVPPKQEAVAPKIDAVSRPLSTATVASRSLTAKIDVLEREVRSSREQAERFAAELEAARAAGLSAEEELALVWKELNRERTRNLFFETETVPQLKQEVETLNAALAEAQSDLQDARAAAAAVDVLYEESREAIMSLNDKMHIVQTENVKLRKTAEQAAVYRKWGIAFLIAVGVGCVIAVAILLLSLAKKFAIL